MIIAGSRLRGNRRKVGARPPNRPIPNGRTMKILIAIICILSSLSAQPKAVHEGVEFTYHGTANSVMLAGDFNGWSHTAEMMSQKGTASEDFFVVVKDLKPGTHQYKFIVDGAWTLDERNPATTHNDNYSSSNSVFSLTDNNTVESPRLFITPNNLYERHVSSLRRNTLSQSHLAPASTAVSRPTKRSTPGSIGPSMVPKTTMIWRRFSRNIPTSTTMSTLLPRSCSSGKILRRQVAPVCRCQE